MHNALAEILVTVVTLVVCVSLLIDLRSRLAWPTLM